MNKNKTASVTQEQLLRSDMEQFNDVQRMEQEFDEHFEKLDDSMERS